MTEPTLVVDPGLRRLWPETRLGALRYTAAVRDDAEALHAAFAREHRPGLEARLRDTPLAELPNLRESRTACKAFGKDPGRHRVSSEALYRRLRQGHALYRINSVVDTNNVVSVLTGFSLGSYDGGRLDGAVTLRLGLAGETYPGIGKGDIDLAAMPLLADARGPFGSPVSDSRRAMIGPDTMRVLTVLYSFSSLPELEAALDLATRYFTTYADATDLTRDIV